MVGYIPRVIDSVVHDRLTWSGAVVIDGPKAVGKTETARQLTNSGVYLDSDQAQQQLAQADPSLVLEGATPRLIDEWQVVPAVWNAVRRAVDDRQQPGQFVLTGSATPADDASRHTGAGRFARVRMRPLSLLETGHSSGDVSLAAVLDGASPQHSGTGIEREKLVDRIITGGWPASQKMAMPQAVGYARAYLDQVARLEIAGLDDVRHDPIKVAALLRSLARTTASETSISTLARDSSGDVGSTMHRDTVARYLEALERAHVIEVQEAWDVALRSRTPLRGAPKRHLVDSSLIAAALRVTSSQQLLGDPETLGLVFESFAMQQLRTLADSGDATVRHFRTKSGLEVDAIVERSHGGWGAFEVKLGAGRIDEAASTLLRFAEQIDTTRSEPPAVLGVIVPTGPSYRRADGVVVLAITSLGL